MKTSVLRLTLLILITGLTLAGCGDSGGKIPIDVDQARGNVISLKQAKAYTDSFISGRQQLSLRMGDSLYMSKNFNLPDGEMFNRHAIALLLSQPGAEGIRIYMGRGGDGQIRMVLVPVDKGGKNIIGRLIANYNAHVPGVKSAYADDDGEAIENGQRCPTMCDPGW